MAHRKERLTARVRRYAEGLRRDVYALYLAYRDPRVPWYARAWALLVVAYALSPIDLIPDALPVIGYLDDLVLVPLGLMLAHRLIPPAVMAEARVRAAAGLPVGTARTARIGGLIVVLLWLGLAALAIYLLLLRAPAA